MINTQLFELLRWVFPNATKQEFKKSVLDLTILLYETQFAQKLVEMLN